MSDDVHSGTSPPSPGPSLGRRALPHREGTDFHDIRQAAAHFGKTVDHLPVCMRLLLESLVRHHDGHIVTDAHIAALLDWTPGIEDDAEIPFFVARTLLQDFTGAPLLADLAALRQAVTDAGLPPTRVEPRIPVDLVIDHSVSIEHHGSPDSLARNRALEVEKNRERFQFFKWASEAFETVRAIPPGYGILHQINLEYLTPGLHAVDGLVYPDSLVGTDSHTTMINGAGIVGWGCGGIEAEAAMLGEPVYLPMPQVTGVALTGRLRPGIGATDLVLHLTALLRRVNVVGQFVEFFGPGVATLSVADRATVANMAPEYGATMGYFPTDARTLAFFLDTGRDPAQVDLLRAYHEAQGTFGPADDKVRFSRQLQVDLGEVVPGVAGPKRPQQHVPLADVARSFTDAFPCEEDAGAAQVQPGLRQGDVVLAAITSCTNTSNPAAMITAGLLARNAVKAGLRVNPHVKTTLAPGSLAVEAYLAQADLLAPLAELGFHIDAFGCTTCIGNSGALHPEVDRLIRAGSHVFASVISGNRNFDGRIHPDIPANYLASPALVVAYALAGTVRVDLQSAPIGQGSHGPVYLADLWPAAADVEALVDRVFKRPAFLPVHRRLDSASSSPDWLALPTQADTNYHWPASTYVSRSPFFDGVTREVPPVRDIGQARILGLFGDAFTTDHLIPAGPIDPASPTGQWLIENGVARDDLHSYGSRRGHHEAMVRGMFANPWVENRIMAALRPDAGRKDRTVLQPAGTEAGLYEAAMHYQAAGTATIIVAGHNYGAGSSRDWAAKGTRLLGIRAVVARSFERIHRTNLVGMGVLPLQFLDEDSAESLDLRGDELVDVVGLSDGVEVRKRVQLVITRADGTRLRCVVRLGLESAADVHYYRQGGILPTIFRKILNGGQAQRLPA